MNETVFKTRTVGYSQQIKDEWVGTCELIDLSLPVEDMLKSTPLSAEVILEALKALNS